MDVAAFKHHNHMHEVKGGDDSNGVLFFNSITYTDDQAILPSQLETLSLTIGSCSKGGPAKYSLYSIPNSILAATLSCAAVVAI